MSATSLLVIDDDPGLHNLVDYHLEGVVDKISHAMTPAHGISMALDLTPTVILLDIEMPKTDGFAVCGQLKNNDTTRDIPIVFLTCDKSAAHIRKALESGGSDYVKKPFEPIELQARIRAAIRMRHLVDLLRREGQMDALTGLSNRAGMDRALVAAISRYARHGEPFGVLMLDLDHFKSINDTYGHGTGDEMLRKVAAAIAATCRPYDQAARYGGEEFTLVLGRAGGKEAQRASGRVLQEVRKAAIRVADRTLSVTCSAGLVVVPDKSGDLQPDLLLQQADAALYEAKTQGRDRLVVKPYAVPHTS